MRALNYDFARLKGDLLGAVSAAVVNIPMSIGFGFIAYSALGPEGASRGAVLAIYSAIFSGLCISILASTPLQIGGATASLSLIHASIVATLAQKYGLLAREDGVFLVIGLSALSVFVAGLLQIAFAAFKLGNLPKYIPYPVVAGFKNGIACLLLFKQLTPVFAAPSLPQFLSFLLMLFTIFVVFYAGKRFKNLPSYMVGIVLGTLLHKVVVSLLGPSLLGPSVGPIDVALPEQVIGGFFFLGELHRDGLISLSLLGDIFLAGCITGILSSMESLMCSMVSDQLTRRRHDGNRELLGQGIGNILSACFAALPCGGAVPKALANYNAGGRTALSGFMSSLVVLSLMLICGPVLGEIPVSVVAAILICVAISLFDPWSIGLLERFKEGRKGVISDLGICLLVAVSVVSINLIAAIIFGVVVASAVFISTIGKSIIRRSYSGRDFHSKKMRRASDSRLLEQLGERVRIIELDGPLFFASSECLAIEIESHAAEIDYLILDLKHVSQIDSSGAIILLQIATQFQAKAKELLLSHLGDRRCLLEFLENSDMIDKLGRERLFDDTDSALEHVEEELLFRHSTNPRAERDLEFAEMDIAEGLYFDELELLQSYLRKLSFRAGERILRQGDPGDSVFFLAAGSASIKIFIPEKKRFKRLLTIEPGVVFGEMSPLDGRARSADIYAEEDCRVLNLACSDFDSLRSTNPGVVIKILVNIAKQLSRHLRKSNSELRVLEESY